MLLEDVGDKMSIIDRQNAETMRLGLTKELKSAWGDGAKTKKEAQSILRIADTGRINYEELSYLEKIVVNRLFPDVEAAEVSEVHGLINCMKEAYKDGKLTVREFKGIRKTYHKVSPAHYHLTERAVTR